MQNIAILFVISSFLFPAISIAQTGTLTGTVTDSTSSSLVQGATIHALNTNGQVASTSISDGVGGFRLEGLSPGPYTLVVSHPSHSVRRIQGVQIVPDGVAVAQISLTPIFNQSQVVKGLANPLGVEGWMLLLIVVIALAALLISLRMVYNSVHKVRTSSILQRILSDYVFEAVSLRIKARMPKITVPPQVRDFYYLERDREKTIADEQWTKERLEELNSQKNLTEDLIEEQKDLQRDLRYIQRSLRRELSKESLQKWREEKREIDLKKEKREELIEKEARETANEMVPATLTLGGMGITGAFFVELTAILVIIFGIIILGLVGVLGTEEIAPILAAIAGYVLGKTTSGQAPSRPSTDSIASEQATSRSLIKPVEQSGVREDDEQVEDEVRGTGTRF